MATKEPTQKTRTCYHCGRNRPTTCFPAKDGVSRCYSCGENMRQHCFLVKSFAPVSTVETIGRGRKAMRFERGTTAYPRYLRNLHDLGKRQDRIGRLCLLRIASDYTVHCANRGYAGSVRREFETSRGRFDSIRSRPCCCCGGRSNCLHHAITIMRGGDNSELNLFPLCYECHAVVHPHMDNRGDSASVRRLVSVRLREFGKSMREWLANRRN